MKKGRLSVGAALLQEVKREPIEPGPRSPTAKAAVLAELERAAKEYRDANARRVVAFIRLKACRLRVQRLTDELVKAVTSPQTPGQREEGGT